MVINTIITRPAIAQHMEVRSSVKTCQSIPPKKLKGLAPLSLPSKRANQISGSPSVWGLLTTTWLTAWQQLSVAYSQPFRTVVNYQTPIIACEFFDAKIHMSLHSRIIPRVSENPELPTTLFSLTNCLRYYYCRFWTVENNGMVRNIERSAFLY
jgi:hypothetical protein